MISELLRPQYEWALRGGLVRVPPTKKAYSPTHTHRLPKNNTKTHSRRHKHTFLYVLKLPLDKMYFWNCIFDQMYEWINKVQIMWHNNVFHIFVWLSKRKVWCRMLTCFQVIFCLLNPSIHVAHSLNWLLWGGWLFFITSIDSVYIYQSLNPLLEHNIHNSANFISQTLKSCSALGGVVGPTPQKLLMTITGQ